MSLGRPAWLEARETLQRLLSSSEGVLRDNPALRERAVISLADAQMQLPAAIGDYTDFYCSREHATHVGIMFRGKEAALQPNWLHLPVGYHGRASSVVVSGTDVHRPRGQVLEQAGATPTFRSSSQLDFELELGCLIGVGNQLGSPIPVDQAAEHIFGYVLVNDWSARDIQKWEYVPLGPFNSKNFATSISPWVVTPQALEPFARPAPPQDNPQSLPYLREQRRMNYDVQLEVSLLPAGAEAVQETLVTCSNLRSLYWTVPQMIAHHSVGGCNLRCGDLLATGTLSCEGELGAGCLLEATWNGSRPVKLRDGTERTYLQDGDAVVMRGWCQGQGFRVGFGECRGTVLPALPS